jgi:pimeloyl-ACP methyl ester carboxylesterase
MRGAEVMARRAASNLAAVKMDLAAAEVEGDAERVALLQVLASLEGDILLYRPQLQHYAVLFGDLETSRHVAVVVPGVGDGTNLCLDWIPGARNLYDAAEGTAVVLWKGYDNPADLVAAAAETIECNEDLITAADDLTAFVHSLGLEPDQSVTVVAHSFGSIVTGAALADCGLVVTDVVVAGSPGMTVDELRQLHLQEGHFFAEQAPGDPVAELGMFGTAPASSTFGGTRMSTNAPGHKAVMAHSSYFAPGSEALENIVDVVTGRYSSVLRHRPGMPEIAGGLVAWVLRMPAVPVRMAGRHYRGPGFRILVNWCRLVDLGATETGNLVCEVLDEGERALLWIAHNIGALPRPEASANADNGGGPVDDAPHNRVERRPASGSGPYPGPGSRSHLAP